MTTVGYTWNDAERMRKSPRIWMTTASQLLRDRLCSSEDITFSRLEAGEGVQGPLISEATPYRAAPGLAGVATGPSSSRPCARVALAAAPGLVLV